MARVVNEAEYAGKRNEILDAAQRFIYIKGYERMTVQDILDELGISKGAFYHYFDSKTQVLEALTERGQADVESHLLAIVNNPNFNALDKLHHSFAVLDRLRVTYKATIVEMLRIWYTDDNAIVRQKVDRTTFERRIPFLNSIVQQGIKEGIFTTFYPDQAGEIVMSLIQSMGNNHAKWLLAFDQDHDESRCIEGAVTAYAAYMDAIERVLGVPSNSLNRINPADIKIWIAALEKKI